MDSTGSYARPRPTPRPAVPVAAVREELQALRDGRRTLDADQRAALIDAVDALVAAVARGPRPGESDEQLGIWANHERDPALAGMADVLCPQVEEQPAPHRESMSDQTAAVALLEALRATQP